MNNERVAIIGGGISGLSAAYELHRQAVPFTLFERSDNLGGLIRTERVNGFTIDKGPDSFLTQKPAALTLCKELGLTDRLIPTIQPRAAFIVRSGRFHPIPDSAVLGIPTKLSQILTNSALTLPGRIRMSIDLVTPSGVQVRDESIGAFFRRRFGSEAVGYCADPLLGGIHAGNVEDLSIRTLFPRLIRAEQTGSVIRALRRQRVENPSTGKSGLFRSFVGGLGELVSALANKLPSSSLRSATIVKSVSGRGPFRISLANSENIRADQLILAAPSSSVAALLQSMDETLAKLCASIPHTSSATVALAYPKPAIGVPLEGNGFVVPRAETNLSLMAATLVSSKWPKRAPEGQVLFRGFLGGVRDPDILTHGDDELADLVHRDLSTLFRIRQRPSLARVFRWPNANPQYNVGHQEIIAAIDDRLVQFPGLQLAGASIRGVGIPDCIAAGRFAARTAAETFRKR